MPPLESVPPDPLVPGTPFPPRPLQHLQPAAAGSTQTGTRIPRTTVQPRPLQHLEVTVLRCALARPLVPGAAVLPRPLQHVQVAPLRRPDAGRLVPRTAYLPRPLEHPELPSEGGLRARPLVEGAAVRPLGPAEQVQVAPLGGQREGSRGAAAPVPERPLERLHVPPLDYRGADPRVPGVPGAPGGLGPLEDGDVAPLEGSEVHDHAPGTPLEARPLEQVQLAPESGQPEGPLVPGAAVVPRAPEQLQAAEADGRVAHPDLVLRQPEVLEAVPQLRRGGVRGHVARQLGPLVPVPSVPPGSGHRGEEEVLPVVDELGHPADDPRVAGQRRRRYCHPRPSPRSRRSRRSCKVPAGGRGGVPHGRSGRSRTTQTREMSRGDDRALPGVLLLPRRKQ